MSTDYNNPDLSQCDIWEQEAAALDKSVAPRVAVMPWPVEKISALIMASAKAEESNRLGALREENASAVLETELPTKEIYHEKV